METAEIEEKWRNSWAEARLFEADVDSSRKKKFITAAFPYPNSPQHIGHARTYTTTDIYARYWRLRGYNVLFPMAFHVTGTPILAMAKRIADKDEEVLSVFEKIYGIDRKTAASLTDPKNLATYFSREIEAGMKEIGYAIDWRRKFYSFDAKFNRFIEWQFKKLKDLGLIIQGEHAVPWCPKDNNAVGAHDTKGDVDPELEEVTAIGFEFEDGFLVATTYRPETIYGVTNIWMNPKAKYVKIEYNGRNLYLAKEALSNLKLQIGEERIGEFDASRFIGKKAKNPVTGNEVPIFPATFVNEAEGTGIVMSVPAHAPYDYLALRDLGKENIEMPQVIEVKGYGKNPAKNVVEKLGVKGQNDPKAEDATKELYTKEAHEGLIIVSKYKGSGVAEAKELIKKDLIAENRAFALQVITNGPVYCRCGTRVVANIVKNQWFIDYGNKEWKDKARQCIADMGIIPEKSRADYLYTAGWLRQKACTRAAGLGTRFPFDKIQMIEALSDSTVYMAFYTIAHLLDGFDEGELTEEFFDYVFHGKEIKSPRLKTQDSKLKKLRESFLYWYPLDSRHSGADLTRNHLPFFIFNHVAIFPRKHWPKQIVTNGFVMMDGAKMSKSMGNILPLRKAVKEYGADVVRFSVVSGADLSQDTDFNSTVAEGTKTRLGYIARLIADSAKATKSKHCRIEKWLLSRLNRKIKLASELYEKLMLRELALEIFYGMYDDLRWYAKRSGKNSLKGFFKKWIVLIAPFMPHRAEEFWQELGEKGLVVDTQFPGVDEKAISKEIEMGEELIKRVKEDVENLQKILNKKPAKVSVFVANETKRKAYRLIAKEKAFDKVMKAAAADGELKKKMDAVQRITKAFIKNAYSLPKILSAKDELSALKDAKEFFEKESGCAVSVLGEDDAPAGMERAKNALPGKPGIVFE